jgi:hypothetical protein
MSLCRQSRNEWCRLVDAVTVRGGACESLILYRVDRDRSWLLKISIVDLWIGGRDRVLFHHMGDLIVTVQFDRAARRRAYPFG